MRLFGPDDYTNGGKHLQTNQPLKTYQVLEANNNLQHYNNLNDKPFNKNGMNTDDLDLQGQRKKAILK